MCFSSCIIRVSDDCVAVVVSEYQIIVLQQVCQSIRSLWCSSCIIRVSDYCVAAIVSLQYQMIVLQQLCH